MTSVGFRIMRILSNGLLVAWAAPLVLAQDGTEPIVVTDLLQLRTIEDIDLDAAGERAVFTVTKAYVEGLGPSAPDPDPGPESESESKNEDGEEPSGAEAGYRRHLWLLDLASGSAPRQLTHGERRDSSPRWSPDGTRIAFVRAEGEDAKPQVWVLPMDGGEAFRVTDLEHGAGAPEWAPDGARLVCSSSVPLSALAKEENAPRTLPWFSERPAREELRAPRSKDESAPKPDPNGGLAEIQAWLDRNAEDGNPRVFTRLSLQGELGLEAELSFSHLFVVAAEPDAEARRITSGYQSFGSARWLPDGSALVCTSRVADIHPDRILDSDLWEIAADGTSQELLLDLPSKLLHDPIPSPDGQRILFAATSAVDPGFSYRTLSILERESGEVKTTWAFDRRVGDARWSDDGELVYFVAPDGGAFPLYQVSAEGGDVVRRVGGPVGVRAYDAAAGRVLCAVTRVENPCDLYLFEGNGAGKRVSSFNASWLTSKRVVRPTELPVTNEERAIQTWVMEPAVRAEGEKAPLVLEMHGGPSAMWGPGELSMWLEFQLLCARGFGVVYCNPRGSGGYGREFLKANERDWGKGPASDVLAALDAACELSWVDRERLFVTGGSYAGYLTAWIISQDHRFRAAVAQRGVYDIATFFGEGNAWRLAPWHFGGYPWEEEARDVMDANSPLSFVEEIRTPLLIIHADRDLRTGVIQSEILYKSLKVLERPVEYVRYPDEGHELSRSGNPRRRIDRCLRIVEFFERHLATPTVPPVPPPAGSGSR